MYHANNKNNILYYKAINSSIIYIDKRADKMRKCPECARVLDWYQRLCSECSHNNRQLTVSICQHNLKAIMNKRQLEYYHKAKITRKEWKARACG
jgi:ribosomal protein L34E